MDIDALIEEHEQAQGAFSLAPTAQGEGDDEDMWDLVREFENQESEKSDKASIKAPTLAEESDEDLYVND